MLRYEMVGKKKYKIHIDRGYGFSLGNMLEALSGDVKEGNWIVVERKAGVFYLVDDNMRVKKGNWVTENTDLGFSWWDDTVQNLDKDSDEAQCFNMSNALKWEEVVMTTESFSAKNIERLCEALEHVRICAWCPGDI